MKITTFILVMLMFLVTAFFVVCYAAGYKIDIVNRQIKQTAMLDIQTRTKDSQIFLNGELKGSQSLIARDLEPGAYDVKVSKDGYHDWTKSVDLEPGQAETLNDISLFLIKPNVEEFQNDINTQSLIKLSDTDDIGATSGELFQNNQLVTRISADIRGACWYPDRRYIAFTADGKLSIIETDGTNKVEILDKNSDTPVVFVNSGLSVIFENDGKTYRATIR